MFRPLIVASAWFVATYAAAVQQNAFCSGVNKFITAHHEQQPASTFCSSYLKVPTKTTTVTVTTTKSSSTTVYPVITTTVSPTTTTTLTEADTSYAQTTVYNTATLTSTSTTFVATSTVYTTTVSSVESTTFTTTSTSTATSVTSQDLSFCTSPAFLPKRSIKKRSLRQKKGNAPKPPCLNGFNNPAEISKACSCLSIPNPTVTRTVTATTSKVSTTSSPSTITQTSPVTQSTTITSTTTIQSTISATQTTTITQTVSATTTTSLATTVFSTTTTTSTATATSTTTVTHYSNFALLASFNDQYGTIRDSVGGSGQGVYFADGNLGTAATFSFQGNQLFYQGQYINSYQAASGSFFVVVDRPITQLGFPTTCTLGMPSFSGDGCVVDCTASGVGVFPNGSGNDVDNYGGAWGFQGSTDRFTVYAVGQTA